MADEDDGPTLPPELGHLLEALRAEARVADGEHLVDDDDVRLDVCGDGEREAQVHPPRVALERRVQKALEPREVDDLVEAPVDIPPRHAEDRGVEVDVLPPGQLGMEAGADVEQRAGAPPRPGETGGGLGDAREHLQQRRLAGAVRPDQAERLVLRHREADVAQSPQIRGLVRRVLAAPRRERLAQRRVPAEVLPEPVALGEVLDLDRRLRRHYTTSANERSARAK